MKGKKYGGNVSSITRDLFVEAVKNTGGIKTTIAKKLGVSTRQFYRWLEKNGEFAEPYLKDEILKIRDTAKNNIYTAIVEGDLGLSRWFLTAFDENGNTTASLMRGEQVDATPVTVKINVSSESEEDHKLLENNAVK